MHLALARKYRPQSFDEVLGQGSVLVALRNAINHDRLHHAYLFCGARGVGKTSLARILAKSINCKNGPTDKPCQKCTVCESITRGNCMDVMEIDGASNNSVDNIRELREQVKYLPADGKYKIYIIDEVHMLSESAFNALLKTLEEPPAHVIFIFATTEPQDLPITILSRCQKYDFRKMSSEQLITHMQGLLKQENATVDEAALRLIARCAQGSVRDALSLLDQVLGYAAGEVNEKLVRDILGLGERVLVEDFFAALIKADVAAAIQYIADADGRGMDLKIFGEEVLTCFRHLVLLVSAGKTPPDMSLSEVGFFSGLKDVLPASVLLAQYQIFMASMQELARSDYQRTVLEIASVKLAQAADMVSLTELLAQLKSPEDTQQPSRMAAREMPVRESPVRNEAMRSPIAQAPAAPVPARPVSAGPAAAKGPVAKDWYELAKWIAVAKPQFGGALRQAVPVSFADGRIEVAIDSKSPSRDIVIERRQLIADLMTSHFGKKTDFVVTDLADEKKKS